MKAVIIAAGFSTRLYPLTHYFPKGLLPIGDKAITGYVMDDLMKQEEISEIVLVTNHRYFSLFEHWVAAYYPNKGIEVLDNGVKNPDERLGAIGDLELVVNKKGWHGEDVLVLSSDTLTTLKLSEFIEFFHKNRGIINSVFDTNDKEVIRKKLGCIKVNGDEIVEFVEKPEEPASTLTSVPFYIFPKEAIAMIGQYKLEGNSTDAPGSIIPWMIGQIPVYAFQTKGYYYDVGTIEVYNKLAEDPSVLNQS